MSVLVKHILLKKDRICPPKSTTATGTLQKYFSQSIMMRLLPLRHDTRSTLRQYAKLATDNTGVYYWHDHTMMNEQSNQNMYTHKSESHLQAFGKDLYSTNQSIADSEPSLPFSNNYWLINSDAVWFMSSGWVSHRHAEIPICNFQSLVCRKLTGTEYFYAKTLHKVLKIQLLSLQLLIKYICLT